MPISKCMKILPTWKATLGSFVQFLTYEKRELCKPTIFFRYCLHRSSSKYNITNYRKNFYSRPLTPHKEKQKHHKLI